MNSDFVSLFSQYGGNEPLPWSHDALWKPKLLRGLLPLTAPQLPYSFPEYMEDFLPQR